MSLALTQRDFERLLLVLLAMTSFVNVWGAGMGDVA